MSELVWRRPCIHGETKLHLLGMAAVEAGHWAGRVCDGGSEVVLDPDEMLPGLRDDDYNLLTVADVLAALDGETE